MLLRIPRPVAGGRGGALFRLKDLQAVAAPETVLESGKSGATSDDVASELLIFQGDLARSIDPGGP